MSDDEDYYDEFDEIFWIEEPEPEIADDLAATATYDAIFYDDPSLEVEDFWSDWDDLSDDYYDEDPTAVRIQRVMANWPNRDLNINLNPPAAGTAVAPPPPKKRKHEPKPKSKPTDAPKTDVASFRGTVWRTSTDENTSKLYEPGDGEKVALLKNWREVFRTSHPATERARARKGAGAAAAAAAPGKSGIENGSGPNGRARARNGNGNGTARKDNGDDHMEEDWDADGEAETSNAPVKAFSPPPVHTSRVIESAADVPVNSKMIEHEYPIEGHEDYKETLEMEARESKEGDRTRSKKIQVNGVAAGKSNSQSTAQPAARGRKRKASVSHDESAATATKNGADTSSGPRSKRIASKKVGETTENPEESTGPVRRSARNRK